MAWKDTKAGKVTSAVGGAVSSATSSAVSTVTSIGSGGPTDAEESVAKFRKSQDKLFVGADVHKVIAAIFANARKHVTSTTSGKDQKDSLEILANGESEVKQLIEAGTRPVVDKIREKADRMQRALG